MNYELIRDTLIKGRALIDAPDGFTRYTFARNKKGDVIGPYSDDATCFCSMGALQRVLNFNYDPGRSNVSDELYQDTKTFLGTHMKEDIGYFNDYSTHTEVLEAWDNAITAVEQLI